jgi:hypothetical protein
LFLFGIMSDDEEDQELARLSAEFRRSPVAPPSGAHNVGGIGVGILDGRAPSGFQGTSTGIRVGLETVTDMEHESSQG